MLLKNIQDVHKENIEHLLSKFGIDFNFDIGLYEFDRYCLCSCLCTFSFFFIHFIQLYVISHNYQPGSLSFSAIN